MIKIVEPGKTTFTIRCYQCDCVYTYGLNDMIGGGTYCPCCDYFNPHYARIEQAEAKIEEVEGKEEKRLDRQL